jgi:hypothetical protein
MTRPSSLPASIALVCLATFAAGCRSGGSNPMAGWWPGQTSNEEAALASAPPFEGSLEKPSKKATPYPTTSTPEQYAVDPPAAAVASTVPSAPAAATRPGTSEAMPPVTYGSKPPLEPRETPGGVGVEGLASESRGPRESSPIGPQQGPYQTLGTPSAAATAATQPPASPSTVAEPAASRFGAAAPPAGSTGGLATAGIPAGPASASPTAGSRYASSESSRFGGASPVTPPPPQQPFSPRPFGPPSGQPLPAEPPASEPPASEPPASEPPASEPPASEPPASEPPASEPPASEPPASGPPAADPFPAAPAAGIDSKPPRRPDPGYRPAGTSSYRPDRAILRDEPTGPSSPIRTAASPSQAAAGG